jgi:Succinate dehydrogenase/Fumarate reductase transmembrane subunit
MPLVLPVSSGTLIPNRIEPPSSSHSYVQTQSFKPEEAKAILNTQRLARPSSPHFTIYQPQLTWVASIANRVTGAGLSACTSGSLL